MGKDVATKDTSLELLRKYFCADASVPDIDIARFKYIAEVHNLNPFAGDITLITFNTKVKTNKGEEWQTRAQPCITISGYLKRAASHPDYRGYQAGIIYNNKDGVVLEREGDFLFREENLLGAWCRVFFKVKEPLKVTRNKEFYMKWDSKTSKMVMPWSANRESMMLVKCVTADGLRKAFPDFFAGQYIPEEFQEPVQPTKKINITEFTEVVKEEETNKEEEGEK